MCVYSHMGRGEGGGERGFCSSFDALHDHQGMGDFNFKHLVIVKFKEGAAVDKILEGMEKLVSEIDAVKSFEWGQDLESQEMLRQGFTHAFLMTFSNQGDFTAFMSHPKHAEFSSTFSAAIEKIVLLDFPAVPVKAPK